MTHPTIHPTDDGADCLCARMPHNYDCPAATTERCGHCGRGGHELADELADGTMCGPPELTTGTCAVCGQPIEHVAEGEPYWRHTGPDAGDPHAAEPATTAVEATTTAAAPEPVRFTVITENPATGARSATAFIDPAAARVATENPAAVRAETRLADGTIVAGLPDPARPDRCWGCSAELAGPVLAHLTEGCYLTESVWGQQR